MRGTAAVVTMPDTRLLIVEDEGLVARDLQMILERLDYVVVDAVATGSDAVDAAGSHRPDLVLMDIALKGSMDGIVAASVIRDRFDIPVVFLTAHADPHTLARARITEPFGYVLKPFEERELHTAVEMGLHKHAIERELRTSRQWLATTLRSIGDGVIVTATDGRVVLLNPAAEALTGWTEAEASGRPLSEVFQIINEFTRQPTPNPVERVLAEGVVVGLANHTLLIARDGSERPIDDSAAPIIDDQALLGVVLVFRDVSERRRLETELRNHARELEAADQRKDEFLAMLAHELRNPLAPLRTGLELLGRTGQDQPLLEIMQRQVEHLVRLVDDLLDVSRITRGKIELRKEPVELAALVGRAVDIVRPLLEERSQTLSVSQPDEPILLEVDAVRLTQVFGNILNNAAKYSPPGGRIELTVQRAGEQALVRVRDEGPGIDPELLPHIFDLFTQGPSPLEHPPSGLGIGLTLVQRLARLHGGDVAAHSAGAGRGCEFTVTLPVLAEPPPQPAADGESPSTPAPNHARRVLVVDDNLDAAHLVAMLLESLWAPEVALAHSGPEALQVAGEFRPDAVLLDVALPGMNGYEIARSLREMPGMDGVVLVALTGYGTGEDRQQATAAGFDHHVVKPASAESLSVVLRKPHA